VRVAVRRSRDAGERAAAIEIRRQVFCVEQGVPLHDELDGRDDEALHLVAVEDGGRVIGTCRLVFRGRTCQLSRMAIEADARGRGLGGALLDLADAEAHATGCARVALHAQIHAQSLYARHGYAPRGPRFQEAGIEHVAMEKALDDGHA
jgi:predicted GNAT family N-acyltransferase